MLITPIVIIGASQNPFFSAWENSDFIGKLIFMALLAISLISWTILFHKWKISSKVHQESLLFKKAFFEHKGDPLAIPFISKADPHAPNAFYILYDVLQRKATELLNKNEQVRDESTLASADITLLENHALTTISTITKYLERHLYLLSTIVTLAPFLGLLGTVYGILITFSGVSLEGAMGGNQQVLGGLSLALTTTVIGLLNAIPALVGYNYLKNSISDFDHEMERFGTEVLSSFTMHYRTVEV